MLISTFVSSTSVYVLVVKRTSCVLSLLRFILYHLNDRVTTSLQMEWIAVVSSVRTLIWQAFKQTIPEGIIKNSISITIAQKIKYNETILFHNFSSRFLVCGTLITDLDLDWDKLVKRRIRRSYLLVFYFYSQKSQKKILWLIRVEL